jgi:hypothetical protein
MLFRVPALAPGTQEQFRLIPLSQHASKHAGRGVSKGGIFLTCSRFLILKGGTGREQVAGTGQTPTKDQSDGIVLRSLDPCQTSQFDSLRGPLVWQKRPTSDRRITPLDVPEKYLVCR